jgi:activator of HSP90 ATPase
MKTRTLRQSVVFRATAHDVYEMLMDSRKHARFSGQKARISRRVGGRIQAYGDYIEGVNLELVADRRIVQSWRGSNWPPGHFSTVTILLSPTKGGTRLRFTQAGVPEAFHEDIRQGWKDFYWTPMRTILKKGRVRGRLNPV